jgi:hypothetical protein
VNAVSGQESSRFSDHVSAASSRTAFVGPADVMRLGGEGPAVPFYPRQVPRGLLGYLKVAREPITSADRPTPTLWRSMAQNQQAPTARMGGLG